MIDRDSRARLLANLNWVGATGLAAGIANFVAMAWFARHLGPVVMGEYAVLVTAIHLIAALLSPGFDQALIRDPKNEALAASGGLATALQMVTLVFGSGLLYAGYRAFAPSHLPESLLPALLILCAVSLAWFSNLYAAPLAAQMNYRYLSIARVVATMAGLGAGVALALRDQGVYALAVRDFVGAIWILVLVKWKSPLRITLANSLGAMSQLLRFARSMWALNGLERIVLRVDFALVGWVFGKELLGMYFVVRGLIEGVLGFLVTPVQTVVYSYYCRLGAEESARSISRRGGVLAYFLVCVVLLIASTSFSGSLIEHILGTAYLPMQGVVFGLLIYAFAILFFENLKVSAMAQSRHNRLVVARVTQLVVLAVTFYPLSASFGILGSSLASAVGSIALVAASWRRLQPALRTGHMTL